VGWGWGSASGSASGSGSLSVSVLVAAGSGSSSTAAGGISLLDKTPIRLEERADFWAGGDEAGDEGWRSW
jgi:hypothetical protein